MSKENLNEFLKETVSHERAVLAFIQAAACFLLALLTPKPKLPVRALLQDEKEKARDFQACRRIQLFLITIYFTFSIYYIVTGLQLLSPQYHDDIVSMTLNAVQGLLFFWLYLELAEITVDAPPLALAESNDGFYGAAFQRVVSSGVFAMVVVPAWCFYSPGRSVSGFNIASACLTGVSLALVVGRLGSKRIDPGALVLGLLYFYSVIQPLAARFPEEPLAQVLATTAALPLKVLLWLVCVWAFTTGILAEYVHTLRPLLQSERGTKEPSGH